MLGHGRATNGSGVVDQHIGRPLLFPYRGNELVEPVALREIASIGPEAAPGLPHGFFDVRAGGLKRGRNADDFRARLGKPDRDGLAYAAIAAGNQRGLAMKIEQVAHGCAPDTALGRVGIRACY